MGAGVVMKVTKKVNNLEGGVKSPPAVSNFSGKIRHSRHQRSREHHVPLVAAHDVPLGIAVNPLAKALCKPALARNMLDAQIEFV